MEGVLNGYVTNPNPTPTLTPNPNRNPNSNPNQINEKIQKETTLEIDQITKCQFGRWKLVKTLGNMARKQCFLVCPSLGNMDIGNNVSWFVHLWETWI